MKAYLTIATTILIMASAHAAPPPGTVVPSASPPPVSSSPSAQIKGKRADPRADPFKHADTDGNGMISRSEAEKDLPQVARKFDQFDTNKDGQISFEELQVGHAAHNSSPQ
jgi:hypothetical protein